MLYSSYDENVKFNVNTVGDASTCRTNSSKAVVSLSTLNIFFVQLEYLT